MKAFSTKTETGAALFETAINIALVMMVALAAVQELGLDVAQMFCEEGIPAFDAHLRHDSDTTFDRGFNSCMAFDQEGMPDPYW